MGLESVVEDVLGRGRSEVEEIRRAALAERDRTLQNARAEGAKLLEIREKEAQQAAERLRVQALARAELESKKIVLSAEKELLDEVYAKVLEKLAVLQDGAAILQSLLKAHAADWRTGKVYCNRYKRAGKGAEVLAEHEIGVLYPAEHPSRNGKADGAASNGHAAPEAAAARAACARPLDGGDQLTKARDESIVADAEQRAARDVADARRLDDERAGPSGREPLVPLEHFVGDESLVGRAPGNHRRHPRALAQAQASGDEGREPPRPPCFVYGGPAGRQQWMTDIFRRMPHRSRYFKPKLFS